MNITSGIKTTLEDTLSSWPNKRRHFVFRSVYPGLPRCPGVQTTSLADWSSLLGSSSSTCLHSSSLSSLLTGKSQKFAYFSQKAINCPQNSEPISFFIGSMPSWARWTTGLVSSSFISCSPQLTCWLLSAPCRSCLGKLCCTLSAPCPSCSGKLCFSLSAPCASCLGMLGCTLSAPCRSCLGKLCCSHTDPCLTCSGTCKLIHAPAVQVNCAVPTLIHAPAVQESCAVPLIHAPAVQVNCAGSSLVHIPAAQVNCAGSSLVHASAV